MYPDINRRTILKSIGAGTVLAGTGVGTASAQGGEFSPCGVEEACENGTLLAKFDYNESTGQFELTESNPLLDLEGVFEFTVEETNNEGEPLRVCWTQNVEEGYEFLVEDVRAKAGPELTEFQDPGDPQCIEVDRYAISHITLCSPVLMQVDFHTGDVREVPEFFGESLVSYVYYGGNLIQRSTGNEPLGGALRDEMIKLNGFSSNGGGTATINYEIPASVDADTSVDGVTEKGVTLTMAVYVRRRRRLGPLDAQELVDFDTTTHQFGAIINDSLSVSLPDPYSCE